MRLSKNDHKLIARLGVPSPTESFENSLQQLMSFRNEWTLHRRTCDASGDPIISAYPASTIFPVYKNEIWWGDSWDPKQYGREVDFLEPFFKQFYDLQSVVPREGTSVFNSENCDYNGHIRESRNCYLSSLVYRCEDTHYSYWVVDNKDVVDCFLVSNSTLAYACIDCENLYQCVSLQDYHSCTDCYFSYQLRGCEHCIGCFNLVNKKYYAFNKPVTKDEFDRLYKSLLDGTQTSFNRGIEIFDKVILDAPHRAVHNLNTEQCIGDHILNSKHCRYAFDGTDGEDVNYTVSFSGSRNVLGCYSVGWPRCEDVYLSAVTRGSQNIAFCYYTFYSSGLRYCDSLMSCHDCLGCIGLRHTENAILNKCYSVHDYDQLSRKLIGHMQDTGEWGNFFSKHISTFPYNQSAAQQYYPLSQEQAVARGWLWSDYEVRSSAPFKIIEAEKGFYEKMNLPSPSLNPQVRHLARLSKRNPYSLSKQLCTITGEQLYTSAPQGAGYRIIGEKAFYESLG